jgi:hypothetical protein
MAPAMRVVGLVALVMVIPGCARYDAVPPVGGPAAVSQMPSSEVQSGTGTATAQAQRAGSQGSGGRGAEVERAIGADAPGAGDLSRTGAPDLPVVPKTPSRVAVIIGIDDYPGKDSDLVAAAADARTVRRLVTRLGFGQVVVLLNRDATRDAILWSARWLARRSRPGTVGMFFYAGHVRRVYGAADGDPEMVDEALLAADGELVPDGELAAALRPATGPLWLAWAGCYAAGFSDAATRGRVSSYASGEESLAWESPALGRSFMVEYVVERAMLGAGRTSVEAAHAYARRHMRHRPPRFRPLLDDRLQGPLDLVGPRSSSEGEGDDAQSCLVFLRCKD